MLIGTQLRKLRNKRHLSHQEIADQLGVARTTVWNWENDESHFKLDHLSKLAEILQVEPADLLPDGTVVKIVNNKENTGSSVNGFVKIDGTVLNEKLLKSLEETIALLKEQNQSLREENVMLKSKVRK